MKAGLWAAVAAGLALSTAPAEVLGQGASQRARAEQRERQAEQRERQDERTRARQEQQRRSAEPGVRRQRSTAARGIIVDRSRQADRNDRRDARDGYDIRGIINGQQAKGNGPAFCRSGAGHPVFGRRWCVDKGFGLGNDRGARDSRDYDIWRDVILGQPRDRRYDRTMNRSALEEILGSVVLGGFESYGRQYGSGALSGRWLDNRGSALQLMLGSTPIARLVDSNRDGRVDSVVLRR